MGVVYSRTFLKESKLLPKVIRNKLAYLLELLAHDPFHPTLHTKQLSGKLTGFFSFRITRDWRAIFVFRDVNTIQLLKVAHRKDIYR